MKKRTSGIFTTALTAVLSLALLGSAAAAAFAPGDTTLAGDHAPDTTKLEAVLNGLVGDGILSAALRDAILAKVAEAGHDEEDGDGEDKEGDKGKSKRDLDPKLRFDVHRLIGGWQKVVMEYLGLERRELMKRLRAGETLADVADGLEGKSAADLIKALEARAFAKVDALVESGKLTAEQGTTAKERVTEALGKILDREFPAKPRAERTPKPEQESNAKKPERKAERESGKKPAHANPGKRP